MSNHEESTSPQQSQPPKPPEQSESLESPHPESNQPEQSQSDTAGLGEPTIESNDQIMQKIIQNPDCIGSLEMQEGESQIAVVKIDDLKKLNDKVGQAETAAKLSEFWQFVLSSYPILNSNYKQAIISGGVAVEEIQQKAQELGLAVRCKSLDVPEAVFQDQSGEIVTDSYLRAYLACRFGEWTMGIDRYLDKKNLNNGEAASAGEVDLDEKARAELQTIQDLYQSIIDKVPVARQEDFLDGAGNLSQRLFSLFRKKPESSAIEPFREDLVDLVNLVESLMPFNFFQQSAEGNSLDIAALSREVQKREALTETDRDMRWDENINFTHEQAFHERCLNQLSGVYIQVDIVGLGAFNLAKASKGLNELNTADVVNCNDLFMQTAGLTDAGLAQITHTWQSISELYEQTFVSNEGGEKKPAPVWAKGDEAVIFIPEASYAGVEDQHQAILGFIDAIRNSAKEKGLQLRLATTSVKKQENGDDTEAKRKETHDECLKILQSHAMYLAKAFENNNTSVLVEYESSAKELKVVNLQNQEQVVTIDGELAAAINSTDRWEEAAKTWLEGGLVRIVAGKLAIITNIPDKD